jgi:hypothetical protein
MLSLMKTVISKAKNSKNARLVAAVTVLTQQHIARESVMRLQRLLPKKHHHSNNITMTQGRKKVGVVLVWTCQSQTSGMRARMTRSQGM